MSKLNEPKLPDKLVLSSFDDLFDLEDPHIECACIQNDVISIHQTRNVEFHSVHFKNVRFIGTSLSHAYFKNCLFEHCELVNAEIFESGLKSVSFTDCRMNGVSFAETLLEDVSFISSKMDLPVSNVLVFQSVC